MAQHWSVLFSAVLSEAKTLGNYGSKDPFHLSFKRGQIIRVLSKSAGDKPELWGGEVNMCVSETV